MRSGYEIRRESILKENYSDRMNVEEPPKTICIVKIAYFIIAWIPWVGDLPTAKATEITHEKSLASRISLGVLIGRKNLFFT